ncbi:MAG: hypothetical protein RBG13Loki_0128 [Promethearchaeota archaeon CR_4]|nr:MAG: hypothetical protein RBG13Loki_0128 [Candidatus Lokiarchaeota archaeon CR_4]
MNVKKHYLTHILDVFKIFNFFSLDDKFIVDPIFVSASTLAGRDNLDEFVTNFFLSLERSGKINKVGK